MAELKSITLGNVTLGNENKAILTVDHGNDSATVSQDGSSFTLERVAGGVEFDISGSVVTTLQDKLVSGTNIKTLNGESLLGSGNIFTANELQNGAVVFDGTITEGYAGQLTVEPSANGYSFTEYNTYSTGETTKELVDKDYVDTKTLSPTGWGIAKTGIVDIQFDNQMWAPVVPVDISDLGFTSTTDYMVFTEPTTGGTTSRWGDAIAFSNDFTPTGFTVGAYAPAEMSGTMKVKYTIFGKGYGAVAFTGEIPTGGTKGQILTKRSDADGDYGWNSNNYVAQGDWLYKINPDNTFEAIYSKSGLSIAIQDSSGAFYRSANMSLTLPTGITDTYNATIKHADVQAMHNNYPVIGTVSNIATTPNVIKYYALSGSSRNTNPNYTVTAHIFGTLVAK